MSNTDDGRRTVIYTCQNDDRDKGKRFKLTEMYADRAEEWAMRVFFALNVAGAKIPDDVAARGLEGMASVALQSLTTIPWAMAKPLLDEMMECVTVISSGGVERALMSDDIKEVRTRLLLRKEVFALHTGFFGSGDNSQSSEG